MEGKNIIPILAIAVTLALITSAVAMWSETLRLNVTVNTGEVKVAFSGWKCSDEGSDPQAQGFDNSEGKDVAWCSVASEVLDSNGNVIKLNVTIGNAYPGYSPVISFNVTNIGTIPVKLYSSSITGLNSTALNASLSIPQSTQLHPGDVGQYALSITVLQSADENAQYTFEVTLVFAQWNEVTTP
ncbi:MAG: hypothetical protein QW039_03450 [Fervidicoccaceae archaeon]